MSSEAPELDALQERCHHVELRRSAGDVYWCDHCAKTFRVRADLPWLPEELIERLKKLSQHDFYGLEKLRQDILTAVEGAWRERDALKTELVELRAECDTLKSEVERLEGICDVVVILRKVILSLQDEKERLRSALSGMITQFGFGVVHDSQLVHDERMAIHAAMDALAAREE